MRSSRRWLHLLDVLQLPPSPIIAADRDCLANISAAWGCPARSTRIHRSRWWDGCRFGGGPVG